MQVSEVKKESTCKISFNACYVGFHQLKFVAGKSGMVVAPIVVNTPILVRRQVLTVCFNQSSGVAVTEKGLVVVSECGADFITACG